MHPSLEESNPVAPAAACTGVHPSVGDCVGPTLAVLACSWRANLAAATRGRLASQPPPVCCLPRDMAPMSALFVCAMESEAVHLRRRLSDVEELASPAPRAWRVSKGVLHGADVRLLLCNIGEANAAGGTSAVLASGWRPDVVINYGCAGAHDASIREGDVVSQTRSISAAAHHTFSLLPAPPEQSEPARVSRFLQSASFHLTPACTTRTAPQRSWASAARN